MAWNTSHSEAKPFRGGRAEMAAAPMSMATEVTGMRWMSPPRRSITREPVAVSTAPAPKKSRLFMAAWLNTWNSAAVKASAAAPPKPEALNARASPRPTKMSPMFSMVEKASTRLVSPCSSACSTPTTPATAPATITGMPHHHSGGPARSNTMRMKP